LKKKSWEELVDIFMNQEKATDAFWLSTTISKW
jgi:hypothetical protein